MASPSKPSVVLVQGSFQVPQVYHSFARLLESHGFPVVQPSFPSLDQDDPDFTKKTLKDDADVVEAAIKKIVVDESKTVLVVMHSYGGLVGGEAVPEAFTLASRRERGLSGGVAHLFFCTAFVMPKGQSIAATVGDSPDHDTWDGRFVMRDPLATMYHDLPTQEEAAYWAARVVPQSSAVMETRLEWCAYGYVPSTYVVCNGDKAVPAQVQEMFAQLAGARAVRRIEAGHSPMLSKPGEVVVLVEEAAAGI